MVTINLESTTSTMVDKELTTHRQFTVDNWSTMVDKVDKVDKHGSMEVTSLGEMVPKNHHFYYKVFQKRHTHRGVARSGGRVTA